MLSSKQRAYLRAFSNGIDTILILGKSGITSEVIRQVSEALRAREIIKGKVLENSGMEPKQTALEIAKETFSEVVCTIGSKFVLYKKKEKNSKLKIPRE